MSQQDNFSTGFLLGAVVGGVVGGVLGSILVKRLPDDEVTVEKREQLPEVKKPAKRPLRSAPLNQEEQELANSDTARRSLEDKIAQLNDAIDDVRDQLKRVGGSGSSKEGLPSSMGNDTQGLELMADES
ncbi:MAG: hypothetical protein NT070_13240 [Cyanobacteria bacterium]|nr:hypothetical protein [Cyanobacteriota bacterium]